MIVFFVVGVLFAGVFAYLGLRSWQRYKLMHDTPTSAIRALRPGFMEAKGKLVAQGDLVESPMTKARCIYYRFVVEEHRRSGKKSRWVEVIDECRSTKAVIDDGTGTARVDFSGAELHLRTDASQRSGFLNDASEHLQSVLASRGRSTTGLVFNKAMRYRETVLQPGDELYVLGQVGWTDGRPSFSAAGPAYLISDQGEEKIKSSKLWSSIALFGAGFAVLFLMALIAVKG